MEDCNQNKHKMTLEERYETLHLYFEHRKELEIYYSMKSPEFIEYASVALQLGRTVTDRAGNELEPIYIDVDGLMRKVLYPVKKISITRAEGPAALCGRTEEARTWSESAEILGKHSRTAPKDGGYDKCDFVVEWTNGWSWEGRYDLKHYSEDPCCIATHIFRQLQYFTKKEDGLMRPEVAQEYLETVDLRQLPPEVGYKHSVILNDFDELTKAINARRLLLAEHAKTPINFYSKQQQTLIQKDRDHAVQFLTDRINRLMRESAERRAGTNES